MTHLSRFALFASLLTVSACGGDTTPHNTNPDLGATDAGATDAGASDTGVVLCTADAQCDDGMFCNGVARCTPGASGADARGCVAATGPSCLPSQTCNESSRTCETSCATAADADGDGVDAMSCGGTDCNDSDAETYPGHAEVCDADHDEDCNPATFGPDRDGDGFAGAECCNGDACGADCDDTSDTIGPSGTESCNLVDDDCDGMVDEGVQTTCFVDADGDGYAAVGAAPTMLCTCGEGFTATAPTTAADCNDANIRVNPAVPEVCNAIDDNCNSMIDEGVGNTYYRDLDRDGQGAAASGTMVACSMPGGYAPDNTDCNDGCATCYIGATEICDMMDNNCNGSTDENLGGPCSVGVGACATPGQLRCNGTCAATPGTPSTTFHTAVAPNGSWDWNCDGVTTPEFAISNTTHSSASVYCATQTCPAFSYCGTSEYAGPPQTGLFTPGGGVSPYCGLGLWSFDGRCHSVNSSCGATPAGPCLGTPGTTTTRTQGCR